MPASGHVLNPWSLVRRPLARLAEFIFPCEMFIPGFHEMFFGEHMLVNVMVFFAGSMLFDLTEVAFRPDLAPPCDDDEPELPLGGKQ